MSLIKKIKYSIPLLFQSKNMLHCLLFAVVPAMVFYCGSIIMLQSNGFTSKEILQDTAQQLDVSSFLGFLSNIGVWLWISATSISFFTLISRKKELTKKLKELLLLSGIISLLLGVDDFFMLHDRYLDQKLFYSFYILITGTILLRHYKNILKIEGFAFFVMGGLLALSILTDLTQYRLPMAIETSQTFEEGFKFVGAATWLYFVGKVASYKQVI